MVTLFILTRVTKVSGQSIHKSFGEGSVHYTNYRPVGIVSTEEVRLPSDVSTI